MIHPDPPPPCSSVACPAVPAELPLMEIALGVCVAPGVIVVAVAVPAWLVLNARGGASIGAGADHDARRRFRNRPGVALADLKHDLRVQMLERRRAGTDLELHAVD